jgi:hypothetical protein
MYYITDIPYFFQSIYSYCTRLVVRFSFDLNFVHINLAGNCFYHRTSDLCYDLSEMNTNEEYCTSSYYSDDNLNELDGYIYAENCRDVNGM